MSVMSSVFRNRYFERNSNGALRISRLLMMRMMMILHSNLVSGSVSSSIQHYYSIKNIHHPHYSLLFLRGGSFENKSLSPFLSNRQQSTSSSVIPTTASSSNLRDSNSRSMPAISIQLQRLSPTDSTNTIVEVKHVTVTKLELSQQLSCPLRDLRIMDHPKFTSSIGSTSSGISTTTSSSTNADGTSGAGYGTNTAFLPRKSGIIVHIAGHTRAIIKKDFTVLLFVQQHYQQQQQQNCGDEASSSNNNNNNLVPLIVDHLTNAYGNSRPEYNSSTCFEFVVLEALLKYAYMEKSKQASDIIGRVKNVLEGITVSNNIVDEIGIDKKEKKKDSYMVMQTRLGQLLPLKNRLDSIEANCAEVAAAIHDVLQNEKDMKAMYLTRKVEDDHGVMEIELLLEDFLLQMGEVLYSLRQLQSAVKNTEEVADIELDLMRNVIMRHELLLESYAFAASCAAAITGLFGMNLLNHLEFHKHMFSVVTVVLIILSIGIALGIQHRLRLDYIL